MLPATWESNVKCDAEYDKVDPELGGSTHTCARLVPHQPPHVCPDCQTQWIETPEGNKVLR